MPERYDMIITGGTCLTPGGRSETDIGVLNGRIAAIGDLARAPAGERLDAAGLHVLPGIIDTQVHFREPGGEHKEDLESGTRSAALGGVTAIFEMPNTNPSTTTAEALEDKLSRAKGRTWCDHAFFIGAAPENVTELPKLERHRGCVGVKMFMGSSTGSLLVSDDPTVERVLANGTRRMAVHSEDEERLKERAHIAQSATSAVAHPEWRDVESALRCTHRLLRLARKTGRRVHVLHITSAEEMAFLSDHKDIATVEVTPLHLTLAGPECYERLGSFAQCNPPVRDQRHQDALWAALNAGIVDVIGTDHAPHTREEKGKPYPKSPSGMPGVQTLMPVMLNHVNEGRLSLERLVDLLAHGPQRIYGIAGKGRLAVGYDADFTLVDLKAKREITNAAMASRAGWTPFDGMKVTGWPVATLVRGRTVMRDDELQGPPIGEPVRFNECLPAEG